MRIERMWIIVWVRVERGKYMRLVSMVWMVEVVNVEG